MQSDLGAEKHLINYDGSEKCLLFCFQVVQAANSHAATECYCFPFPLFQVSERNVL